MNNGNETLGLRVVTTNPEAHKANVNVNSKIEVTFSSDVNPSSFHNSIVVFEDYKKIYKGATSLKNYNDFNIVKGTVTYANRVLVFIPEEQLKVDTKYIVMLNNTIKDVVGNAMANRFIYAFSTELVKSYGKVELVAPFFGSICDRVPTVEWTNQQAESYILQISKTNTFEVLLHENFILGNKIDPIISYTPDIKAKEGVYYIRVKSEGGEWSDFGQFFFKEVTDAVVSFEDASESIYLEDFLNEIDDTIEVLEFFPSEDSLNISLKINIIYIKIKGKIEENSLDINGSFVFGEPFDEEDDMEYTHGQVNGSWSFVYDKESDATFIIFTPID